MSAMSWARSGNGDCGWPDMDYLSKPFGQMPFIMAKADYVTKLHAICVKCGSIANYSYRKIPSEGPGDAGRNRCV